MLLPACHYHLWEMRINFGSLWHQGHLHIGEHGRDFRPVWVEGNNSPDKWVYALLISDQSDVTSVHHCASILKVGLGACWNCILTQSVNFTVFLITTPRHSILSSFILLCPIIIPCCSRFMVIPSKFSSNSASASPSRSDVILLEQSPYKASS
jgi:hypothetical protein